MKTNIDHLRTDVEKEMASLMALASQGRIVPLFEFEKKTWTMLLALGRALVTLYLARSAGEFATGTSYLCGGRRLVVREVRTSEVGTRFGKVRLTRPFGVSVGRGDAGDRPVDRRLGLCAGFSLGVVMAITRLCAQMAFATARETFRQAHEWAPSPRALMRMVDAVGAQARPFLETTAAPPDDGEILVVQVDGGGAPMIGQTEHQRRCQPHRPPGTGTRRSRRRVLRSERPRVRRTTGKKSKNAKIAVVGVIYTLKKTTHGLDGPINKRMYATFDSHEALFQWLHREAVKRGYGQKRTEFLADGSEHIWRLQKRFFPDAECCLDFAHVVEKVWIAGECIHKPGSPELKQWVARQTRALRRGKLLDVLSELDAVRNSIPKTGPGNKGRRSRLGNVHGYLSDNHDRLAYHKFIRADLDIGSGAVEGAVRNLVRMRLDGPGMRWSRDRSESLLHLRCVLLNGQWDAFVDHANHVGIKLKSAPVPTRIHDAKAAA
jgi:hypothetical protein